MSKLSFVKFQGAGNDFILIDDRTSHFSQPIAPLCHRKFGIGADGLILLQLDPIADFRMRIFNSDGSKTYRIATADRIVEASFLDDKIAIQMGPALHVKQLYIQGVECHSLNTGVPHLVTFVPDVQSIDILKEGAAFRYHPQFQPSGTNVNFAALQDNGAIRVRTYERGLEGETLACGTGAAAVGFIASQIYKMPNPVSIHFPGGVLEIYIEDQQIKMVGQATKVFEGTI